MKNMSADALDDFQQFEYSDIEQEQEDILETEAMKDVESKHVSKKRNITTSTTTQDSKDSTKSKKKQKKADTVDRKSKVKDANYNEIRDLKSKEECVEFLWNRLIIGGRNHKLTDLEVNDQRIEFLVPLSQFHFSGNVPHDLIHLREYHDSVVQKYTDTKKKTFPKVIIISSSALRCVDVIKSLRECTNVKIGKLFAKHLKVDEQVVEMKKKINGIVVGTPNRISKVSQMLGEQEFYAHTSLIIFDCFIDVKNRSVFDIPELEQDLKLLFKTIWKLNPKVNFSFL